MGIRQRKNLYPYGFENGESAHRADATSWELDKGKTYTLTVSKMGYKTHTETLVADWTGLKTERVALEEQTLPSDLMEVSEAAYAPLSGLASGSSTAQGAQKSAGFPKSHKKTG